MPWHMLELGKLWTLSDLYKEDIPGDANFIPYYPTSASCNKDDKRAFFNIKWQVNDELSPLSLDHYNSFSNHIIVGDGLKIIGAKVPEFLMRHWQISLNQDIIVRYGEINEEVPHIELFPTERVKAELHAVNPEMHYEISSKRFIMEVPCQQAELYTDENVQFPCYVKLSLLMAARGVWRVENRTELESLLTSIKENMPTADYVINEMIQNAENTFSTVFYLSKKGGIKWIGVSQPQFAPNGLLRAGIVDMNMQEHLELTLAPIVRPVAIALHEKGYFGVVDIDVVMNDKKQGFIVDINPRVGGTTTLILIMHFLKSQGFTYGMKIRKIEFAMCIEDVISFAEECEEGKVIVLGASETGFGKDILTKCVIFACGKSEKACLDIFDKLLKAADQTKSEVLSKNVCGGKSVCLESL